MSDTIQDLYGSFAEQMGPIQEDDRYFRYLFELAQASETTIDQQREELVKVVDEEWISVIEDSLDAINNVIEKPRRFITTEQEVVPVSLAKKISADSVRHLSQNTQFLAPSDDGGVHPTKILNVSMAETYDLYENRFVYHLIQRLLTFVDKRTDVIFWSTGNEVRNRFTMHSKIGDAYEEIEYNVEMTVKDRQNFAENDADNMDTFMRIDRVRRLVMVLRGSSFCQLMKGCSVVRSPIQRTNLIMKDPNYRKCFQLWQFMERYDKVGYSIQVKDSALAFDDEYLTQMYTNLINNYAVFKSLVSDDRNLTELASEQREPVVPKFVKEIKEELVDSCDIPDVEVRKVFVEEVTQAQLDAEAALEEQRGKNEELLGQLKSLTVEAHALRDERDDLAGEVDQLKQREAALMQRAQLAESESDELRDSLEDAEAGKRAAEQDAAQARSDAQAQLERVREETAAEVRDAFDDAAAKVAAAKAEADEAVEAAGVEAAAAVEAAKAEAAAEVEAAKAEAGSAVAAAQAEADEAVAAAKAQGEAALAKAAAQAAADKEQAASELAAAKAEAQDAESRLAAAAKAHEDAASQAEQRHAQELAQAKRDFEQRLAQLNARLEQSERARARAEKRAEGNKLSNYLRARLRGDDAPAEPGDASGAGGSASGGAQASGLASSDEADAPSEGGRK
ncbi:DUF2357 domain-containing protein [uncultured Senegalimassilia sp.]|uniref:DUF2357 domain-containing protein n=1 Tax=uncultured Senegalimassilia sp. TaxID=1714350 RepID=UPI002587FC0E|nr:DUF2357 domain-containing protein [uncultured Senegalimassilia sp.]